jgi:hypothetical protein
MERVTGLGDGMGRLREAFNQASSGVRVLLLTSPT